MISSIYERWVPRDKILTMSTKSAEVSKLVTNAFLAQRISSINAIASVCEETAADVRQVARAVGKDSRVGPHFLDAGLGFGGNTLPADLHHLVGHRLFPLCNQKVPPLSPTAFSGFFRFIHASHWIYRL